MVERQYWPSKWVFILAAIGSAAGLGNLWRFPFLAFEHGGATFVFVIILANLIIGIPLLLAEVAIGQMMQKGAPDAFKKIKGGFRFIGWTMVMFAFFVIVYYVAVMGWGIDYLAASFSLPAWAGDTSKFFFEDILQLSDGPGTIGGFSIPILIGVIVSWLAIYFSVWKGVKSVSKVVVWTATLPFLMLAILIVRAVTLDGAGDGLRLFLIPDWTALRDPQLWIAAFSQVFFSLSLAFGVMLAYGSCNPRKTEMTKSVFIIAAGNFLVSFMSGIVIFGTLGYMAAQQGVPVTEVIKGGPSLAFVVFPQAISLLPAFATGFAVLFFIMFFLLALDSAFSLIEGFAAPFRDRFPNTSVKKVALWITLAAFVVGLLYTTKAGLYYLDITDHFIVNYGIVITGTLLAIVVGWLWKGGELKAFINEHSQWKLGAWWDISVKFISPIFLIILLVVNIIQEIKTPYEGYPTWALLTFGLGPIVLAPIVGAILDNVTKKKATVGSVTTEPPGDSPQEPTTIPPAF